MDLISPSDSGWWRLGPIVHLRRPVVLGAGRGPHVAQGGGVGDGGAVGGEGEVEVWYKVIYLDYFCNGGVGMLLIYSCFLIARTGASLDLQMEGVVSQWPC